MSIEINKASDAIGAEISGVDLSMPIESQTVSEIRQAFFFSSSLPLRKKFLTLLVYPGLAFPTDRHPL